MTRPRNVYQHWLGLLEQIAFASMVFCAVAKIAGLLGIPGTERLDLFRTGVGGGACMLLWAFAGVLSRVPQDE